jgi:hypothetical protein
VSLNLPLIRSNMKLTLLALLGVSAVASAHCTLDVVADEALVNHRLTKVTDTFSALIVEGQRTGDYQYVRMTKNHYSHSSVSDVTSKDMRCGGEETMPSNTSVKTVNAGASVGFFVDQGLGHPGPLQFYMAQAPSSVDLSAWDGSGRVWFKIAGNPPKIDAKGLTFPEQGQCLPSSCHLIQHYKLILCPIQVPRLYPSNFQLLCRRAIIYYELSTSGCTARAKKVAHRFTLDVLN